MAFPRNVAQAEALTLLLRRTPATDRNRFCWLELDDDELIKNDCSTAATRRRQRGG